MNLTNLPYDLCLVGYIPHPPIPALSQVIYVPPREETSPSSGW